MWAHDAIKALSEGKKVARLSFPKGDYVQALQEDIDLSDLEPKSFGVESKLDVQIKAGTLIYCNYAAKTASIGYELTGEDRQSQDWIVVE